MSDPTPGTPDQPEPELPESSPPGGGDETVRVPVAPEVAWNAPEAPRAMPWDAPVDVAPPAAMPLAPSVDAAAIGFGTSAPATPTGVLSAATVGWVTPPPEPVATGQPGWVIASVGVRFAAWFVDGILAGFLGIAAILVLVAIANPDPDGSTVLSLAYVVILMGIYFLYFVGFWTSNGKATPGMRIFKLQVANATDGKRLAIGPAVIRWLALGYFLDALVIVPVAGLVNLVWNIVLLITTSSDPMHQGLHDRWAKSVVVRPESAGAGSGVAAACLVIILIIALISLTSIVALILLGSQVSDILSAVGESI